MKKFYLLLALSIGVLAARSQGSIIMKINGITAADGDKILAFQANASVGVTTTGASKPVLDNIMIKKPLSISTQLIKTLLLGTHLATVDFEFMDNNNKMVYQIQLSEASVTKLSHLAPECPTCQALTDEIWFSFTEITYNDPVNKKVITYNVRANTVE